jgi:hypothetical protein
MASSEILRRVALEITDVSEELRASSIRVTRIGELGTRLAVTSNRRTLRRNTRRNIPEDAILHYVLRYGLHFYVWYSISAHVSAPGLTPFHTSLRLFCSLKMPPVIKSNLS